MIEFLSKVPDGAAFGTLRFGRVFFSGESDGKK
jgi:hypothetical protein